MIKTELELFWLLVQCSSIPCLSSLKKDAKASSSKPVPGLKPYREIKTFQTNKHNNWKNSIPGLYLGMRLFARVGGRICRGGRGWVLHGGFTNSTNLLATIKVRLLYGNYYIFYKCFVELDNLCIHTPILSLIQWADYASTESCHSREQIPRYNLHFSLASRNVVISAF